MTDLVSTARALALHHHAGQTDKQGRDYFRGHLEPIATALAPFGEEAEALGYLHDIIEDTKVTAPDLREAGIPWSVVDAVLAMSKDALGPEDYTNLIDRSARQVLSARGKLADNTWNILSNPGLAKTDPVKAKRLLNEKYLPARRILLEAAGLSALEVFDMEMFLRRFIEALDGAR